MVLVTSNRQLRLLCLHYVGQVKPEELAKARAEITVQLADLPEDFRLLGDMSQLENMGPECATEIGRTMELIAQHGVGLIVRVIPDPAKDFGLNILTIFHYPRQPRVITAQTLAKGLQQLAKWE